MKTIKLSLSAFIIIGAVLIANSIFSQSNPSWDDARYDRIPYDLLQQSRNRVQLSPLGTNSTIITNSEGYDNFYLGVDFAEPHISLNPRNPLQYFTAFNTNEAYYTMNGLDWKKNNPSFGFSMAGDPVTAYDSLGTLYYDNMYQSGSSIVGTKVAVSTDNGLTWSIVNGNSGNDKNWIAADQTGGPYANYVYGTMTNLSTCSVMRSTNRGASFSVVQSLSPHGLPGAMPCVGPNVIGGDIPGGVVYVVTNSGNSFSAAYTFFKSTNGGTSFSAVSTQYFANYVGSATGSPLRNSVQNMRTRPYPFIAADNSYGPYRGRLYCVYASNTPAGDGNKPDIFCRYSTDQGSSWSSAVVINDDPNTTANNQWHPSIWCDKNTGRLFVKWLDTRDTPTSDSCDVYASYSDNGGVSFAPNKKITTKNFRINCTSCGGGGTPMYLGDYDAVTSFGRTSKLVWTDFRNNSFGSYTAYYPDYAMKINPSGNFIRNNDSTFVRIIVPSVKGYSDVVKFSAVVDTLPGSGSIQFSFVNGKDSITSFPDSVMLRIKSVGTVTPGSYGIIISGKGPNGIPVHRRIHDVFVNAAPVIVGTNRDGICDFQVDGIQYNSKQTIAVPLGNTINVKALSPKVVGGTRYVFQNWSDGGDTAHNVVVNNPMTLTANYKAQFRLIIASTVGNTFGGNVYYDSGAPSQFGVLSRYFVFNGTPYYFRGWTGSGTGSYTSSDSSGIDSAVTISLSNALVENARWTLNPVGILNLSSEIPKEFKLYQNYPNPFNPTTNFEFDIPKSGLVKIVVYDILGKEVETLVNESLQPGKYKLNFNGDKLTSGIYFYKISSVGFNDIKRMILIK